MGTQLANLHFLGVLVISCGVWLSVGQWEVSGMKIYHAWVISLLTSSSPWTFFVPFPQAEMQTWCWGAAPTTCVREGTAPGCGQGGGRSLSLGSSYRWSHLLALDRSPMGTIYICNTYIYLIWASVFLMSLFLKFSCSLNNTLSTPSLYFLHNSYQYFYLIYLCTCLLPFSPLWNEISMRTESLC